MSLIPSRRKKSKTQKALLAAAVAGRTAGRAGKKVAKTKAVQRAPKTAATVWAGKRSGKFVRGVVVAIVGVVTLQAIRRRRASEPTEMPTPEPAAAEGQPTSPTPASSQTTETGAVNGSAPVAEPSDTATTATPPHGDPVLPDEGASGPPPAGGPTEK